MFLSDFLNVQERPGLMIVFVAFLFGGVEGVGDTVKA